MAVESIAQLVALLVAVLGIIWHQQHSTDKLRDEFTRAIEGLRDEFTRAIEGLREDFNRAINGLRAEVTNNGQRIARIEGFLRIGMPAPADSEASETPVAEPVSAPAPPAPSIEPAANE